MVDTQNGKIGMKLEDPADFESTAVPADAPLLKKVGSRPYFYYLVVTALLAGCIALLPQQWYLFGGFIALFTVLIFTSRSYTVAEFYQGYLVFHYFRPDGSAAALTLKTADLVAWEAVAAENRVKILYNDRAKDRTEMISIPAPNLYGLTSGLNRYYKDKSSTRVQIEAFAKRIRAPKGKSHFDLLVEKLRRRKS